jgi:cadmium resistance protein CadD (predicted permease)
MHDNWFVGFILGSVLLIVVTLPPVFVLSWIAENWN